MLSLDLILAAALIAGAIVSLATSTRSTRTVVPCIGLIAIAVILIAAIPSESLERWLKQWHLVRPLEIAAGILGLTALALLPDRRIGTALAICGCLLALRAMRIIGGWAL
ncbi:MAG: hypothetical protein H0V44_01195 [Planctomycetes bacterium]|nr:hypothetical protein [Planctomycetota bacterium]